MKSIFELWQTDRIPKSRPMIVARKNIMNRHRPAVLQIIRLRNSPIHPGENFIALTFEESPG